MKSVCEARQRLQNRLFKSLPGAIWISFMVSSAGAQSGLIADWPLSSTSAVDIVSGVVGNVLNPAGYGQGQQGSALSPNGSWLQVTEAGGVSGARTLTAWVYLNSATGYGAMLMAGGDSVSGDFFGITGTSGGCASSGQYHLYVHHLGASCYVSNISLQPNTWSHVAVTWDGASTLQFYVNGSPSQPLSGAFYGYGLSTYTIGGSNNARGGTTDSSTLDGLLDDVRIYNRALSQAEIQSVMNPPASQVATPTFSPGPGLWAQPLWVYLQTSTPGATIRYTTDGSTPSETNGTVGTSVYLPCTTTLKMIAYEAG
jgi:hypothetical protein